MELQFIWNILKVEVIPKFGVLNNVVKRVNYQITGADTRRSEISALAGETLLLDPNPENFIEYKNITEEQMIEWVKTAIGTRAIYDYEEEIRRNLKVLLEPELSEIELPWVQTEEDMVYLFKNKKQQDK